jgi:hypothetical protein
LTDPGSIEKQLYSAGFIPDAADAAHRVERVGPDDRANVAHASCSVAAILAWPRSCALDGRAHDQGGLAMRGSGILGVARGACCGWPVLVVVAGLSAGLVQAAGASSKLQVATGRFSVKTDFRATPAGGAELSSGTYAGGLAGSVIDTGTAVVRSNGSYSGHGMELCDPCAIGGKTGAFTATYRYSGSGTTFSGTETFTRGFGKLAGLAGGGSFKATSPNSETYSYSYRF